MQKEIVSEYRPELMGVVALNAYARGISASRLAMYCSHIGQALVIEGATVNRTVTGAERAYAEDDHSIRFPCNAEVITVIRKYDRSVVPEAVSYENNTVTSVIYQNVDSPSREIGVLNLETFHSLHKDFGFNYTYTSEYYRLAPKEVFSKGTVLARSPIVTDEGDYRIGIEAQVAMMSHPGIIEDGVIISKSFSKRLRTKGYGVRTVSWGNNSMPVNLYGNPNDPSDYRPFPDIGHRVMSSGLLFATRSVDELSSVPLLSARALREVDFFDKTTHAIPGAKVIDVIVYKGNKNKTFMPNGMDKQLRYYYNKTFHYYQNILYEYRRLKKSYGDGLMLSPEFSNLLVKAEVFINMDKNTHITPCYQKRPLDEWHVDIIFEYDIIPTVGFKLTAFHGD